MNSIIERRNLLRGWLFPWVGEWALKGAWLATATTNRSL